MPSKAVELHRYDFTVDHDGTLYQCERVVTGQRTLRQTIRVNGVGSRQDSANYGSRGHPLSSMEGIAKLIAHEILREQRTGFAE